MSPTRRGSEPDDTGSIWLNEPAWLNEPEQWNRSGDEMTLVAHAGSRFWRFTGDEVVSDTGHFLGTRVGGDFTAELRVSAGLTTPGDSAGIMVRLDAERWVILGMELVGDGVGGPEIAVGSVVTHAVSDHTVAPVGGFRQGVVHGDMVLRIVRRNDALLMSAAPETSEGAMSRVEERLHRLAYLRALLPALVGPYAASPYGRGFPVTFLDWVLRVERWEGSAPDGCGKQTSVSW
jgi:uncharacterized protein